MDGFPVECRTSPMPAEQKNTEKKRKGLLCNQKKFPIKKESESSDVDSSYYDDTDKNSNQNHKHPDQEEQHFSAPLSCPMANNCVQITHGIVTMKESTKTVAEAVAAVSAALLSKEPSEQSKTDNNSNIISG